MKKKILISAFIVLILISILPVGAFASDSRNYYTDIYNVTWTYTVNADGMTATIIRCSQTSGSVTFPSVINGYTVTALSRYKDVENNQSSVFGHYGNFGVTSVTLPSTLKTIDDWALSLCTKLTSVSIPNGVTSIGTDAFFSCNVLASVSLPDSLQTIGEAAFNYCPELTSISLPSSLTSIGSYAFADCSKLTSITWPGSLPSISLGAFSGCAGLKSFTIPNSVTSIQDSAFAGCSGLTSITIPSSVTSIERLAFSGCTGLTSVTIPGSITKFGPGAFQGCTGLTNVGISDGVKIIGADAFNGCTALTNVAIPKSVTSIQGYVFYGCTALTNITIPSSVTSIGGWDFQNSGITSMSQITIQFPVGYTTTWNTQPNGSGTTVTDLTTATTTSYAVQTPNTYLVTFESNSGSTVPSQAVVYGSLITAPANPTRTGYTFAGWFKDSSLSEAWKFDSDTLGAGNMTLYAAWTINSYSVKFQSNGGSSVDTITQNYNTSVVQPAEPTRSGYTFKEWYSDAALTQTVSWPITLGASDVTLYAAWTANNYTVTFDAQSGSVTPVTITVTYDSPYGTLPVPTRLGYSFSGWFTGTGGSGTQIKGENTVSILSDTTLYAAWTAKTYTVTFDAQSGSVTPTTITVTYDSAYGTLPVPTRPGYSFGGWFTETCGSGSQISSTSTVGILLDTTLYAFWTAKAYTVTFDPQSGNVTPATIIVTYDNTYGTLPVPTRPGYSFAGWFTESGGSGTQIKGENTVSILSDTTLYAAWTAKTYTVTFDPQSGSVTPATLTVTYDSPYGTLPTPTREGFAFAGWFTETGGSGTKITDSSTVGILADTTLYAYWTANTYLVTFDPQSGTVTPSSTTVTFGGAYGTLPTPVRTGYEFDGWFTEPDGSGTQIAGTGTVNITANETLYAFWKIKAYTITFDSNDGSSVASITKDYNTTVAEPEKPTRSGYYFAGWYSDSALKNAVTWPLAVGAENITLYASWNAAGSGIISIPNYTVSFDSGDGNNVINQTVTSGDQAAVPPDPEKPGYVFDGWFTDSKCTVPWRFTTKVTGSMKLFAKWKPESPKSACTVTFDSNGGEAVESQPVNYGNLVSRPADPARNGYVFAGWFKDSSLNEAWDFSSDIVTKNMTLYAKWDDAINNNNDDSTSTDRPGYDTSDDPAILPTAGTNRSASVIVDPLVEDDYEDGSEIQPPTTSNDNTAEMQITYVRQPDNAGTVNNETPVSTGSSDSSLKRTILISVLVIAVILLLILSALVFSIVMRMKGMKKVVFYDNENKLCSANIHNGQVNITKAISRASGKSLTLKLNEKYIHKEYGTELDFRYHGASVGTVVMDGNDSFNIDLC